MKFIQANIYGFGKWVDQTIEFNTRGPICFYGENESGKTTIQQFILYVLFGLPPRKLSRYQPMNSNKIGGMLIVEDDELGRYRIERMDQKLICYTQSGDLEDEEWLQSRLKGLNREVFTSIYAFSAIDLAEIRQMKKEQLSDVLFSVGLTGSTTIYEAEKKLKTNIDRLFKKQGSKPIINEQIKKTKASQTKLMETQEKELVYGGKQAEIDQLKLKKAQYIAEETILQSALLKEERIQTLLPQLHQYAQCQQQLQALPNHISFPENGLKRLETGKIQLLPLKSELQAMENRLAQDRLEKETNEKSLYEGKVMEQAIDVAEQKATYDNLLEQQKSKRIQMEQKKNELDDQAQLITVTIEEVDNIVLPFHTEKQWEELARTEQQLLQAGDKQTTIHEELLNKEADLKKERQTNIEALLAKEQIEQLQSEIEDYHPSKPTSTQDRKWRMWEEKRMKTAKGILIGALIVAVLTAMIALFKTHFILLTIPIVVIVAGVMQYVNVKRSIAFFIETDANSDSTDNFLTFETYEHKKSILSEQFARKEAIATIDKQLEQVTLERNYWKANQTDFLKKENKWIQALEKERQTYPFLKDTELPYWIDLLAIIRAMKKILAERKQVEKALQDITEQLQAIEAQGKQVSHLLRVDGEVLSFQDLQEIIQKQETTAYFIKQYDQQIKEHVNAISQLKQKVAVYEEEIHTLYRYAKVESEEAYLQVAKQWQEINEMKTTMSHTKQQITRMFSEHEADNLLSDKRSEHEVKLALHTLQEELHLNRQQQAELAKQLATIELEIEQLELSNDHSTAIYQHQMEIDTLQDYANEWAILKVAQTVLAKGKVAYQENHLTEVLQYTSTFFKQITDGNYEQVLAPSKKESFQVEGKNHIRYTIDKLSQGTVDQLYIALRLAISIVMSHRYKMPLMMDDAFVHFDQQRTDKMIDILTKLGESQQVILFTCKKDIANQFKNVNIMQEAKNALGGIK